MQDLELEVIDYTYLISADVEEGIQGAPSSASADDEILIEIQEIKDILVENIDIAKDFVGVGFGVMLGIVVGYTIMRFLGR